MNENLRYGTFCYDNMSERLDIHFDDGDYYGGLHCGTPLKVFIDNLWVDTRVEYSDDWYLVGISKDYLQHGLKVGIRD